MYKHCQMSLEIFCACSPRLFMSQARFVKRKVRNVRSKTAVLVASYACLDGTILKMRVGGRVCCLFCHLCECG